MEFMVREIRLEEMNPAHVEAEKNIKNAVDMNKREYI